LTVLRPILRWTLAAGALALSLSLLDSNVYSQLVKSDWRALARWLNHEDKHEDSFESGR